MNKCAVVWSVTLEPEENEALEVLMAAHGFSIDSDGFEKLVKFIISDNEQDEEDTRQKTSPPRLSGLESLLRDHGPDLVNLGKTAVETALRKWAKAAK